MDRARGGEIILQAETAQFGHLRRNFVGSHGNDSAPAKCKKRQCDCVIARENHKVVGNTGCDRGHLRDASGCFLDAYDHLYLCKTPNGSGFNIDACASGDVVKQNGFGHGLRNGAEVLVKTFLSWLVVVRSNGEDSVHTHRCILASEANDLGGVISAGPSDNGYLAI